MFVKTRIPKDTNCIRFYGPTAKEAHHLASLFLGGKGRIANALDVMEARIRYGFQHPIWKCYITTASTEWFGLDRDGEPIIAIIHNPGPLFEEQILKNYVKHRNVRHHFNVVDREHFLDVLDGKYGEAHKIHVNYAIAKRNENQHPYKYYTKGEIEKNNLIQARIGYNDDYIQAHFEGSMEENIKNLRHQSGDMDTAFLRSDCEEYFPVFIRLVKGSNDYFFDSSNSVIDLNKEAVGHFLCFGSVENVNSDFVVSKIDLLTTQADCAFLAIINHEPVQVSHKLSTYCFGSYRRKLQSIFINNDKPVFTETYQLDEPGFYQIEEIKEWYFTQRLRQKVAVGEVQEEWFVTSNPTYSVKGEPEFLVKSLKPLGRRTIKVPTSKGFYTPEQIKYAFKNPTANAFQILNGFRCKGKNYLAVVEYYKAEIYFDRIIPTESEILQDHKLLGRIV